MDGEVKLTCDCGKVLYLVNGWVACSDWCGRLTGGTREQRKALENLGRVVEVNKSKVFFRGLLTNGTE